MALEKGRFEGPKEGKNEPLKRRKTHLKNNLGKGVGNGLGKEEKSLTKGGLPKEAEMGRGGLLQAIS